MPTLVSLEVEIPKMHNPAVRSTIAKKLGRDYLWLEKPNWSVAFWGLSRPRGSSDHYEFRGPRVGGSALPFAARWMLACIVHLFLVFTRGSNCLLVAPNPSLAVGAAIGRRLMRTPPPLLVKVEARLGHRARLVQGSRVKGRLLEGLERLALRSADIVVVRGDFTKQEALAAGADPHGLVVVPPQPAWGDTPDSVVTERKRANEFLFAGRLVPEKGVHVLLQALQEIGTDHDIRLLVVGEGPERYGLERMTRALPADTRVEFLGHVAPDELRLLYSRASAVVLPSIVEEGLGRVLVEAGLHGCALIGSDHGGIRDVIRHGVSGLLVKPGDAVALAGSIKRIARDPELVARLGTGARARAKEILKERRAGLVDLQHLVERVCGA